MWSGSEAFFDSLSAAIRVGLCPFVAVDCVRGEGFQGVLTLICGGVAQTCHDDRVVELKEQLGVEEVDGEGQEGEVREEGRGRVKENAPWMTWR